MYDYISGTITELNPAYVVIDNHGMGYMINISLTCYNQLQGARDVVRLYVYEALRDDAHLLYGFADKREREFFLLLITVSGVGPNSARLIQSSLPPAELEQTIASGNAAMLKAVKGIGAKTAQRIIVDLKDKIKVPDNALIDMNQSASASYDEALSALVMLGFTQQLSQKTLKALFLKEPGLSVENAIKKALKMM